MNGGWLTLFKDLGRTLIEVPLLAWIALVAGGIGLWGASHHTASEALMPPSQTVTSPASNQSNPTPATLPAQPSKHVIEKVTGWLLLREISLAAVVSFFLAVFLDQPLRQHTTEKLTRDAAPSLIAALTVPEMRHKMRQICEFGIIRTDAVMQLSMEELTSEKYKLTVRVRANFRNISNSRQSLPVRIAVDEETNGKIVGLHVLPINIQGVPELHWPPLTEKEKEEDKEKKFQPLAKDGQTVLESKMKFPSCENWKESYIEVTGEYEEELALIGNVAKTIYEGYAPLMGIEIEYLSKIPNLALKVKIPYHDDLREIASNRWRSELALLPGERVDLVFTKQNVPPVSPASGVAQPNPVAPVAIGPQKELPTT